MARGPFIKYEQVIRDIVDLLGVNKPQATSRTQIAEAIGVNLHTTDKVLRQLRALDILGTEAVPGGFREDGTPIRSQEYTIRMSADDIIFLGKKRHIKWGSTAIEPKTEPKAEPKIEQVPAERLDPAALTRAREIINERADRITPHVTVETPVVATTGEERSDNPFAVLKPLKADSPVALIAAARQYKDNRVFIDEEVKRFAERGLTLDPAVIGFPVDERLEHIGLIVDYVTRLEGTNERLQKYANEKGVDDSTVKELRARIERQEEQLNRLAKSRAEEHAEAVRLSNQHSGKVATLAAQIRTLEQEKRDLQNSIKAVAKLTNGSTASA